jgi:hypothetical protein
MAFNLEKLLSDNKLPYVGVRLRGATYYFWFEVEKCEATLFEFTGQNGWGNNHQETNLNCENGEIKSVVFSEDLP